MTAFGLTFGAVAPAGATVAHKTYKPGEFCAKAKLGNTTKDGKLTLVCKKVPSKVKTYDRWERR